MRITSEMVVTEADPDIGKMLVCVQCFGHSEHAQQRVLVFSASGARTMLLWGCKEHPLPESITDLPGEVLP